MSNLDFPHKIALIRFREENKNSSAIMANENLASSYKKAYSGKKIEMFYVSNEYGSPEVAITKLKTFHPDLIVILDERINLATFFKMTHLFELNFSQTKFILHVYGDILSRMREWKKLSELYPDLNLNIAVATPTQKKIVELMLKDPIEVSIIPYPIEDVEFEKVEAEVIKKELGFAPDSILLGFAGRYSFQKNILGLLKLMKMINEKDPRFKFVLSGDYDDKDEGIDGVVYPEGTINVYISHLLQSIDPYGKFIKILPKKPRAELFKFYQAFDGFISLSLHHLKDYSKAAAEALWCGNPLFLTKWGGHISLGELSTNVHFVDVIKDNGKLTLNLEELANKILSFPFDNFDREACAKDFRQKISIDTTSEKLKSIVKFKPYLGVSSTGLKAIFDTPTKYIFSTNRNHTIYFGAYWNDPT